MGNIQVTYLIKDSKSWSKKDAKFLVDSIITSGKIPNRRTINLVDMYQSEIHDRNFLENANDNLKPKPKTTFWDCGRRNVWKLGWTFFQRDEDEFHCRETLTYSLQRNLAQTGRKVNRKKLALVRETLPKTSYTKEHFIKFTDAFLGMSGVSKEVRNNFIDYDDNTCYAIFPAPAKLWGSSFLTAPATLVGLMRHTNLLMNREEKRFNSIPEILELLLEDKKESWNSNGRRQYKYYSFGSNAMLWFALLWMDKLKLVCDRFKFVEGEHYADGPNTFMQATALSVVKVLGDFNKAEQKEMCTLLAKDKEDYHRLAGNYHSGIRSLLYAFEEAI